MVHLRIRFAPNVRFGSRLCKNGAHDMILPWFWRESFMKRFVEGEDRGQGTLFPERLEDWIGEDNPVRVIDVFVDEIDLGVGSTSLAERR